MFLVLLAQYFDFIVYLTVFRMRFGKTVRSVKITVILKNPANVDTEGSI